jgi:hypothetical protein
MKVRDINKQELSIGDVVIYSAIQPHKANAMLVKTVITNIKKVPKLHRWSSGIKVMMGVYTSTEPDIQILKINKDE